jgi:hypothetical protein
LAPEIEHLDEYTLLDLQRKFDLEKIVVYQLGVCLIRLILCLDEDEYFEIKKNKGLEELIEKIEDS